MRQPTWPLTRSRSLRSALVLSPFLGERVKKNGLNVICDTLPAQRGRRRKCERKRSLVTEGAFAASELIKAISDASCVGKADWRPPHVCASLGALELNYATAGPAWAMISLIHSRPSSKV